MKFIALTFLIVLVVGIVNPFFPFWIVMIAIGVVSALLGIASFAAFLAGGLGMGLVWIGQSFYLSIYSGSDLPQKMGDLMGLGSGMTLVAITGALGFLLGAFSAWTGAAFRQAITPKPTNIYRG
ncbi:hypothetical protein [Algoriphagus namhaensis]